MGEPEIGFRQRHTNLLAIGGPVLGVGGAGLVALASVALSVQGFHASPLFWWTLVPFAALTATGLYITIGVFADWPLPEPSPNTRRQWRFGVLVVTTATALLALWYLRTTMLRGFTWEQVIVLATFVVAAITVVAFPERERPTTFAPSENTRSKAEDDLRSLLARTNEELDYARRARGSAEAHAEAMDRVARALARERDEALEAATAATSPDVLQQAKQEGYDAGRAFAIQTMNEQLEKTRSALDIQADLASRLYDELRERETRTGHRAG